MAEPVYISKDKKLVKMNRSFARQAVKISGTLYISVPAEIVREFGMKERDFVFGTYQSFLTHKSKKQ